VAFRAAAGPGLFEPADDAARRVLGRHAQHDPAALLQRLHPADVPGEHPGVEAVVGALVLHRDPQLLPAQIDDADEATELVVHRQLGARPREAGADHQQPQPGLPRGLGAGVDQLQYRADPGQTAAAAVALGQPCHVGERESGGPGQCVDRDDRGVGGVAAGQVERGALRGGHPHPVHHADFVRIDPVGPHRDSGIRPPVLVDDGGGPAGVDPACSVQRRGREPGEDAVATGPQARGSGPQHGGELGAGADVDVPMHRAVAGAQGVAGEQPGGHRGAAQERLVHDRSLPTGTDNPARVTPWR